MLICDIAQFYSPLGGGVKRYLEDKRLHLARRTRHRHLLVIPAADDGVDRHPEGLTVRIRSPRLPGSRSYRILLDEERILEVLGAERPDLIEVGDPYRSAWIGLRAGRLLGVPVVAFYHSDYPRAFGRTVERFLGATAGRIFSRWTHHYVVDLYNRMDATVVASAGLAGTLASCGIQRIHTIPLGTDPAIFFPRPSRDKIRTELKLPAEAPLLLFIGRLAREKNIRPLVGLTDPDLPGHAPWHLLLVGDGELGDWVRKEAETRPNLHWLPYCGDPARLAEIYSAADLFVHAGACETFGIVSLEAQACGTRVLAVEGGGLADSLAGESPQLLARSPSTPDLAAAVRRGLALPDSPELRRERRRRITRTFSVEATFGQLTALYEQLADRSRIPAAPPRPPPPHVRDRSALSH
ncbi:MAG: glycosyltransferase family 1 protein [Puniceicoccaceae bacterium]|nr:MAG: glycosyltransferase family 1 protein [Puniceicoccaceae bacterium]